tara:strand:+ start:529 stop:783 length:255 start_codon:yes stop_codon:yes gene_type:complete
MVYFTEEQVLAALNAHPGVDMVSFFQAMNDAYKPNESGSMFTFGKYKGKSVLDVMKYDQGYIRWFMKTGNSDFPQYDYIANMTK